MTCEEARLLIGAEPQSTPPALSRHLESCPACAALSRETSMLEADIRKALELGPVKLSAKASVVPFTPRGRAPATAWSRWALAASLLAAIVSTLAVWVLRPTQSLAHEVAVHVAGEPKSWTSAEHITPGALERILKSAGVALDSGSDRVVYARSCWFRGRFVPHLVLQTAQGPVTVMILRYEHVRSRQSFKEDGLQGVITPAPHGSMAVLSRGDVNIDAADQQIRRAIGWLPTASENG